MTKREMFNKVGEIQSMLEHLTKQLSENDLVDERCLNLSIVNMEQAIMWVIKSHKGDINS